MSAEGSKAVEEAARHYAAAMAGCPVPSQRCLIGRAVNGGGRCEG